MKTKPQCHPHLAWSEARLARDHLTLQVEVPVYPEDLPPEDRTRDKATDWRKVSIPIHHLESLCIFGASAVSPPALDLCWEHGVAVNYLSQFGQFQARMNGVANTSVTLRRTQFRAADDPTRCAGISRQIIAGKIQNSRNSLLRAARETEATEDRARLEEATDALARQIQELGRVDLDAGVNVDQLRGGEGMASSRYFAVFSLTACFLKSRPRKILSGSISLMKRRCNGSNTTESANQSI